MAEQFQPREQYQQRYQNNPSSSAPPWDIFHLKKFKMYGTPWNPDDRTKCPTAQFYIVNGNPRFKLYMNDGSENKAYSFALSPGIAATIFIAVIEIANRTAEKSRYSWKLRSMFPHIGPRTEKPQIISTITVGRDSDDVVYMALHVKGLNVAKFPFIADFYAEMTGEDGESLGNSFASTLVSKGWATQFMEIMNTYLVTRTKEPPPSQSMYKTPSATTLNTGWAADDDVTF